MNKEQMVKEIRNLRRLIELATKRAVAQYALIDKLTAANLKVQKILRQLEGAK